MNRGAEPAAVSILDPMDERQRAAQLASRIGMLFDNVLKADGRRHTGSEVSAAAGITPGHLSRMRRGHISDMKMSTLESLAQIFDMPPSFWMVSDEIAEGMIRARVAGQVEQSAVEQATLEAMQQIAAERAAARAAQQQHSSEIESAIADFLRDLEAAHDE